MTQEIQTKTITAPNPSTFAQGLYEAFKEGYEYDAMQPAFQRGYIYIATLYKKSEGKAQATVEEKSTRGRKGKQQEGGVGE